MSNVPQPPVPEAPTFQVQRLAFAARVDRLAGLALECLAVAHDPEAVALAAANIVQIKTLAAEVLR